MCPEDNWIDEQKKNRQFRGGGKGNDADRMLEYSETNRWLKGNQGQMIISIRMMANTLNAPCLFELCDMVEKAQLCADAESRKNFMKVAIEQWQAKLAALRRMRNLDTMTQG